MAPNLPLLVVGGTFDRLHAGHKRLLTESFAHAQKVGIGVTTDALAQKDKEKGGGLTPFAQREGLLKTYLRRLYPANRWFMVPLDSPQGKILEPETPGLAVSEETFPVAVQANAWRVAHKMKPLTLVVVGRMYGEDLLPIASRRIRSGDIDTEGHRHSILSLGLRSPMEAETRLLLLEAFRQVLGGVQVTPRYLEGAPPEDTGKPLDYVLGLAESKGTVTLEVLDRDGVRLESSAVIEEGGKGIRLLQEGGILRALAATLIANALQPRVLARAGALPPSIVLDGSRSEAWPTATHWTRKVYSPSGVFPFE